LLQEIWIKKRILFGSIGVFLVLGVVFTWLSPENYESDTVLIPETSSNTGADLLRQYGGLLGIGSGSAGSADILNINLYPALIESYPVQIELLNRELNFSRYDTTTSILNFYTQIYKPAPIYYIKKYTIGLSSLERQYNRNPDDTETVQIRNGTIYEIPGLYRGLVSGLKDNVEIISNTDGTITITATMPDPLAAAEMVETLKELLKSQVVKYRTEKANQDLQFVQEQYNQVRQRFIEAQQRLAEFRDQNQNLATARAQTEEERLQSEYNIAFNVYQNVATQLEQAKIKVQQETPVFTSLEPAVVPSGPDSPNLELNVMVAGFLGGFLGVVWILGIYILKRFNIYFKKD